MVRPLLHSAQHAFCARYNTLLMLVFLHEHGLLCHYSRRASAEIIICLLEILFITYYVSTEDIVGTACLSLLNELPVTNHTYLDLLYVRPRGPISPAPDPDYRLPNPMNDDVRVVKHLEKDDT